MSEEVEAAMTGLRKFMFENVYMNPKAKGEEDKAVHMIEQLYEYYIRHLDLPVSYTHLWQQRSGDSGYQEKRTDRNGQRIIWKRGSSAYRSADRCVLSSAC